MLVEFGEFVLQRGLHMKLVIFISLTLSHHNYP